jgi:hypothetical protein
MNATIELVTRKVETAPTMDELRAMVRAAGYHVGPYDHETESRIFAASLETGGRGTYGHCRFEVTYNKDTGWLVFHGNAK